MADLASGSLLASKPFQLYRALALGGDGILPITITGDKTITVKHPQCLAINGGLSTRVLTLPTAAAGASKGMFFVIRNSGSTNDLTINKPASTLVVTLNPGEACIVVYGTAWTLAMATSDPASDTLLSSANTWTNSNDFGTQTHKVDVTQGSSGTTGTFKLALTDNLASALDITEGANSYLKFVTSDGVEAITAAKTTTFTAGMVPRSTGTTAITATRAIHRSDSCGMFTVGQGSAYTITVDQPATAGERYIFQLVSPGAFDVSIVATGCTFEGTITIDASTIPATGSTLKFASGAAILGDNIEMIATSTTKFFVRAIGSGAGGITIA